VRMPWSKTARAPQTERVTNAELARGGADGDGKEHDLQYWLDSGFLRLPPK
jgi:hypothetical protein